MPRFADITDINDILLIDEPKTYEFIERIFASIAKNFISRNVHIGMDEAYLVGLGKYLDKHGYCNRFELLNRHLAKVSEIARKYGFTYLIFGNDKEIKEISPADNDKAITDKGVQPLSPLVPLVGACAFGAKLCEHEPRPQCNTKITSFLAGSRFEPLKRHKQKNTHKGCFFVWCRWSDSNRHGIATTGF